MKEKFSSVLHKDCGGEIVLVGNKKEARLACKKCDTFYGFVNYGIDAKMKLIDEFVLYKKEKKVK